MYPNNKWDILQIILMIAILVISIASIAFNLVTGNVLKEARIVSITLLSVQFIVLILEILEVREREKKMQEEIKRRLKEMDRHIPRID